MRRRSENAAVEGGQCCRLYVGELLSHSSMSNIIRKLKVVSVKTKPIGVFWKNVPEVAKVCLDVIRPWEARSARGVSEPLAYDDDRAIL